MIYCLGDSFTAGDELSDFIRTVDQPTYSTCSSSWPNLLSKKTNLPTVNLGRGACGNTRLIKRCMDLCISGSADIIVIAWTNPERIELADDHGIWDTWPARRTEYFPTPSKYRADIIKWTAVHQNSAEIEQWYYANWLRQIILLQKFLSAYEQKYIMLQSHVTEHWNHIYYNRFQTLFDEVDAKYFLGWPYESMMNWTADVDKGPHGHFLEQGHEIVAEKVYEYIRNLGWLS